MEQAKPDAWKIQSMPEQFAELDYQAEFDEREFKRLSRGLVPREMENKWFIYMQDDVLHCHESWTGYCIYQLALEPFVDGYRVRRAIVNRQPNQYQQTDDEYDAQILDYVIGHLLLGYKQRYPFASENEPANQPPTTEGGVAAAPPDASACWFTRLWR